MNQIKAEYITHMGDDLMVVNAARYGRNATGPARR